ncbi:Uncharacterised protein [Staphylococcus argenteus]|nr:hypothetical protein ERS140095_00068 [Staphylococcus argenteus]CDR25118.1 hypothetical protein ERS140248_02415 [Staphylococcus argenteus]SGX40636.1 Uncharacterised protein [Staphylococcus argenteus]SGX55665.1 Uncharacterised protein [Staphylococcus argenteus]SHC45762.1 Uncharacterised protein [Staphylococcus argenteus]
MLWKAVQNQPRFTFDSKKKVKNKIICNLKSQLAYRYPYIMDK